MYKKIIGSLAILLLIATATLPAIAISTPQQTLQINTEQHRLLRFTAGIKIFEMINDREHRLVNFDASAKKIQQINDHARQLAQLMANTKTPMKFLTLLNYMITFNAKNTRNIDRIRHVGELDINFISSDYVKTQDFPLEHLYLTISQIRVHLLAPNGNTITGDWITLLSRQPTIDLVALFKKPMAFTRLDIPLGQYDMVEITIASARAIFDGVEFRMSIPSSVLILKTPFSINLNKVTSLTYDFDVMRSIQETAARSLVLKPAIKLV